MVMISSIHAEQSVEWMSAYAASKAALERMAACLASEWPDVKIHCVAPGPVIVERTEQAMNTPAAAALWNPHLPVGRFGTVRRLA